MVKDNIIKLKNGFEIREVEWVCVNLYLKNFLNIENNKQKFCINMDLIELIGTDIEYANGSVNENIFSCETEIYTDLKIISEEITEIKEILKEYYTN